VAPEALKAGATRAPWLETPVLGQGPNSDSVRVVQELERYRGSNAKATLVFPNRTRYGRVHLFGLDTLRCGRVPERNDVGLLVLPLTPENHIKQRDHAVDIKAGNAASGTARGISAVSC